MAEKGFAALSVRAVAGAAGSSSSTPPSIASRSSGSSPASQPAPGLTAKRRRAWNQLVGKIERLEAAGLLGGKPAPEAACEFNSMMEGLANAELRGAALRLLPEGSEQEAWRSALTTVVRGFAAETREAGDAGLSTSASRMGS